MPPETIYEGPHEATIYLRTTGYVRLGFSDPLGQQRKFGLLLDLVEPLAQLLGQTHRVDRLANDGLARWRKMVRPTIHLDTRCLGADHALANLHLPPQSLRWKKFKPNEPREAAPMTQCRLYMAPIALIGLMATPAPAAPALSNGAMTRIIAVAPAERIDAPLVLVRGGGGGGRGGGGGGGARSGGGNAGGGASRGGGSWSGVSGGNRANVNSSNVNRGNINTGNVNVNRNVNVSGTGYGGSGWGGVAAGVAVGAVVGAAAANTTAPAAPSCPYPNYPNCGL